MRVEAHGAVMPSYYGLVSRSQLAHLTHHLHAEKGENGTEEVSK